MLSSSHKIFENISNPSCWSFKQRLKNKIAVLHNSSFSWTLRNVDIFCNWTPPDQQSIRIKGAQNVSPLLQNQKANFGECSAKIRNASKIEIIFFKSGSPKQNQRLQKQSSWTGSKIAFELLQNLRLKWQRILKIFDKNCKKLTVSMLKKSADDENFCKFLTENGQF